MANDIHPFFTSKQHFTKDMDTVFKLLELAPLDTYKEFKRRMRAEDLRREAIGQVTIIRMGEEPQP